MRSLEIVELVQLCRFCCRVGGGGMTMVDFVASVSMYAATQTQVDVMYNPVTLIFDCSERVVEREQGNRVIETGKPLPSD